MLRHDPIVVGVVADLSIRVPRSAPGTLVEGTRSVVEAVDGVVRVETVDITSMTPNLNDLFIEATVSASIRLDTPVDDDVAAARSVLLGGFGIDAVNDIEVDRSVEPSDGE